MKEFWMILGLLFHVVNISKTFAFGVTNSTLRKNSSFVHVNARSSETVSSTLLNSPPRASSQPTSKRQNETITASNYNTIEFSYSALITTEPILHVLSTFSVAHTSANEIVKSVLSSNVPPENFHTRHSSQNTVSEFFNAEAHSTAISSEASIMLPEATSTKDKSTGILPSFSADKKYLSSSKAADYSNVYSYQAALEKSSLLDVREKRLISPTRGQFSSSGSILGQISDYYDTVQSVNEESRLFTEVSLSLTSLPRTFLRSSKTIWKNTQSRDSLAEETALMFSSRKHATPTSDTKASTAVETRKFSSISGMPQATLVAKTIQEKSDYIASTGLISPRGSQVVTSSVAHSQIQQKLSHVSTIVRASPSVFSKSLQISSQSETISTTPVIQQAASNIKNSAFSSRPPSEFPILTSKNKDGSSSVSSKKSSSNIATKKSASTSFKQTTNPEPHGTMSSAKVHSLVEKTPSLAKTSLQTHSTRKVDLQMTFADSTKNAITKTSVGIPLSSRETENLSSHYSKEFLELNTDSFHQTRISTSGSVIDGNTIAFSFTESSDLAISTIPSSGSYSKSTSHFLHIRSSATASSNEPLASSSTISEIGHQIRLSKSTVSTKTLAQSSSSTKNTSAPSSSHMFIHTQVPSRRSPVLSESQIVSSYLESTVRTILDESKLQTSSSALSSSTSSRAQLTSQIIVPLPEGSVTSYKADKIPIGATVNPTKTRASMANVSTEFLTTAMPDSNEKLFVATSSVTHSSIQKETSVVPSVIMASSSATSKIRYMSSRLSSPFLSSTKAETKTRWLTQSMDQPLVSPQLSASKTFSSLKTDSFHQTQISRSSLTQSSDVTDKLVAPSSSYSKSMSLRATLTPPVDHSSPSDSSKIAKTSSKLSSSASMTISTSTVFPRSVASGIVSKVSSEPGNEIHRATSSYTKESSSQIISAKIVSSSDDTSKYSIKDSVFSSQTVTSLPQPMRTSESTSTFSSNISRMSLPTATLTKTRDGPNDFAYTTVPPSQATQLLKSSVESSSSLPLKLSSMKAETKTKWLTQSMVQSSYVIPFSFSKQFPASSTDRDHPTSSTSTQTSVTSTLDSSSSSYSKSVSQIPHNIRSTSTLVWSHSLSPPGQSSSATSGDQSVSPSSSSTVTTLPGGNKWRSTSIAVSATSPRTELTTEIIIPAPGQSEKSSNTVGTQIGATVNPTKTSSSSGATVNGNVATGSPTTAGTDFGNIKLLIIVAIIPSVILCVFFAAVMLFRRRRKRRNKAVYSIKLEYADENNGFRKRCANSRLDLSLKGIHIDLEFPNAPSDRERRASFGRDSPRYSRGSTLSETQMRELQLLSRECKENMEWISEVIAREMEASICGRIQPVNRESVYSVKEKENYEPSEKGIIRRESSKRGRETVKWRIPVVQRRDSEDFDQNDSVCTEDTTLFPDDWKDSYQNSRRPVSRNNSGTYTRTNQKSSPPRQEGKRGDHLEKELKVPLLSKKPDGLQSRDNDNKEKELEENKPLVVNLNSKKEDTSQGKRPSTRPRRFETL